MLNQLINAMAYHRCFGCHQSQSWPVNGPLCSLCQKRLPWLRTPYCKQCAAPLPDSTASHCGECLKNERSFDCVISPFLYDYPIKELIHAFKFDEQWRLTKSLASFMVDTIQHNTGSLPDCLTPIPLHKKRLATRGYNQSLLLARAIGKKLSIPVSHNCYKSNHTTPQSSLPQKERLATSHAFSLKRHASKPMSHVMLIDDVMTTGSTVNQLAKCLKKAGTQVVSVCCLARACQASDSKVF